MNDEERIRQRAHRIWEEVGRPEGMHREHWDRACREIQQSSMSGNKASPRGTANPTGRQSSTTPTGNQTDASQSSTGLVGGDDVGTGLPDAMGVDDLNVTGPLSDPKVSRPTTGRSKLVGT